MILFCAHFAKWLSVERSFFKMCHDYIKRIFSYNVHGDMTGRLKTLSKLVTGTLIMDAAADNSADQEQVVENEQISGFRTVFV